MKTQNYANHARLVPLYHGVALLGALILLVGSVVNFFKSTNDNSYDASLLVLVALLLLLVAYFTRAFSLKAQDRAIRAEENFRHYVLTGKPLDGNLSIAQIVGLRFASDEEFPELAKKALSDKLSAKEIKKSIKNWKPDTYRV
tara:strand:- start:19877 stop:20305 length:429 start_codon:yes stop_codon:yes gene_type:complete